LGYNAGSNLTAGANDIHIGNAGVATESGTTRIGTQGTQTRSFVAGIYGVNEGGTILPVYINSNGQLGTQPPASAQRFKQEINPMDCASEAILGLKPVTFRYKNDNTATSQFGLIAEEVAEVNPDLVVRDGNGDIYTVRYDAVNAMLLNEFLKDHRKNEEQQKQINVLTAQLKEQAAQIQKVSAQLAAASPSGGGLEASKFATRRIRGGGLAPQVVNNP
jgi:Chaperone of endosialidase